jgi:hypothetical protein
MEGNITNYALTNQKILNKLDRMDYDIQNLSLRAGSPCVSITGLKYLQFGKFKKFGKSSYKDLIYALFKILKLPYAWILAIEPYHPKTFLPAETHIFLISDQIKRFVFNSIVKYIRSNTIKKVYVKVKY